MVGQFGQQTGIAWTIDACDDVSGELTESSAVQICLFRVVQEALNNVAKHSDASRVNVRLATGSASSISLRVKDTGQGMCAADRRKPEQFGSWASRSGFVPMAG